MYSSKRIKCFLCSTFFLITLAIPIPDATIDKAIKIRHDN